MNNSTDVLKRLQGGLVVSCQAWQDTPLFDPIFMRAMAESALQGGAKGIRANGAADIRAIKATVPLPVIGINKAIDKHGVKVITPTLEAAREVVDAGSEIVAVECTAKAWPDRGELRDLLQAIASELKVPVMADISTLAEAELAMTLGATFVATTCAGNTPESEHRKLEDVPDLQLISELKDALGDVPVLAEGRFWEPRHAVEALERGAHCVCIGTAITAPWSITQRFVKAIAAALPDAW